MRKVSLFMTAVFLTVAALLLTIPTKVSAASDDDMKRTNIIYDFGDGSYYAIQGVTANALLTVNPDGSLYIDAKTKEYVPDISKIRVFVEALDNQHPHNSDTLVFTATDGRVVNVTGGTNKRQYMDYNTEALYIYNGLETGLQEVHAPGYSVGNTYIEIDVTNQTLYYYENGEQKISTPIVTGNIAAGHNSPAGYFYVRAKNLNQSLVGPGYVSFVNYWMPIKGNVIGIHDATWRSKFGGSVYKTSGSHGCINVPLSNMEKLYPMVQVGTPVVVFY